MFAWNYKVMQQKIQYCSWRIYWIFLSSSFIIIIIIIIVVVVVGVVVVVVVVAVAAAALLPVVKSVLEDMYLIKYAFCPQTYVIICMQCFVSSH